MSRNPFALTDPFGFNNPYAPPAVRASSSLQLTPEEEESLISEIASPVLSGLAYVGETLDKPGRALRGLLAGRPEELLNLLPFSDTLGITDPAEGVSGRDLLESAGVLGANQEGFDFGDVLGFGAEVLLDPLLLLGGPLSAGGRAAKSANLLGKATKGAAKAGKGKRLFLQKTTPRQVIAEAEGSLKASKSFEQAFNKGKPLGAVSDDILDAPLGGLATLGIPFREPFATLGTGPLAQKFAGKILDPLGEAIRFSPVGRGAHRLFNRNVRDTSAASAQKLAADISGDVDQIRPTGSQDIFDATRALTEDATRGIPKREFQPFDALDPYKGNVDFQDPRFRRFLGESLRVRKGANKGAFDAATFEKLAPRILGPGHTSENLAAAIKSFELPINAFRRIADDGDDFGFGIGRLFDLENEYWARILTGGSKGNRTKVSEILGEADQFIGTQRKEAFSGLPQGTAAIQDVASNESVRGLIDGSLDIEDLLDAETYAAAVYKKGVEVAVDGYDELGRIVSVEDGIAKVRIKNPIPKKRGELVEVSTDSLTLTKPRDSVELLLEHDERLAELIPDEFVTLGDTRLKGAKLRYKWTKLISAALSGDPEAKVAVARKFGLKKNQQVIRLGPDGRPVIQKLGRRKIIAKSLREKTPEQLEAGLFGNDPLVDAGIRMAAGLEHGAVMKRLLTGLADEQFIADAWKTSTMGEDFVTLGEVLGGTGAKESVGLGFKTRQDNVWRKIAELRGRSIGAPGSDEFKAAKKAMMEERIPRDLAENLIRMEAGFRSPDAAREIMQVLNSTTNLFKALQTSPWPAFHTRNLLGGQFNNWLSGMFSVKDVVGTKRILQGGSYDRLKESPLLRQRLRDKGVKNPTAEQFTDELRQLSAERGWTGRTQGQQFADDTGETLGAGLDDILDPLPGGIGGSKPILIRDAARQFAGIGEGVTNNPLKGGVRGVGGIFRKKEIPTETTLGFVKGGETLGELVEGMNRLAPAITLLRKGVDPDEITKRVFAAQVDYSSRAFSKTERDFFLKAIPFYKFQSRMIPYTLRQIIENPGGKLPQTIRAIQNARESDGSLVPDFVAGTAAIPLPGGEEGASRFLTGFGIPSEDALSLIGGAGRALTGDAGAAKQLGLNVLSRTAPHIKTSLEFAFGQSTFQTGPQGGRPLEDMDPLLGRLLSNVGRATGLRESEEAIDLPFADFIEPLAANSPISRLLSTAKNITDRREGRRIEDPLQAGATALNTLTGFRITDVSEAVQEGIFQDRLDARLKKAVPRVRKFSKLFVPEDVEEQLTPEERREVEAIKALQSIIAAKKRERKKAAQL